MFKNCCRLSVHISKTLYQQLFFTVKVAVNRPGRNSCQFTDILDAHSLQAILPHSLDCRKNDPRFGVIQSNHAPRNNDFSWRLSIKGLYTNLLLLTRASGCLNRQANTPPLAARASQAWQPLHFTYIIPDWHAILQPQTLCAETITTNYEHTAPSCAAGRND